MPGNLHLAAKGVELNASGLGILPGCIGLIVLGGVVIVLIKHQRHKGES